jgi:hypothetical protein
METCANIKLPFFLHVPILLKKYIIQYCGTLYGYDYGGLVAMFVDPTYLHIYDNESNDEKADENHSEEPRVVDMCKLMTLDDTSFNVEKNKYHNQHSSSSIPTKKMFIRMGDIMQEIINEVKEGGVQFIDHTTSLLCVIAIDVQNICVSKVNEVMHFNMVFHSINDGLGNSMHQMKDWHEMMLEHANIHKERVHELKKTTKIVCTYPPF